MENRITVSICGEEYTFTAEESPAYMQKVAAMVDSKMASILSAGKVSLTDAAMAFGQVEVLSEDGETAFLTDPISGEDAARQAQSLNVLACMRVLP